MSFRGDINGGTTKKVKEIRQKKRIPFHLRKNKKPLPTDFPF